MLAGGSRRAPRSNSSAQSGRNMRPSRRRSTSSVVAASLRGCWHRQRSSEPIIFVSVTKASARSNLTALPQSPRYRAHRDGSVRSTGTSSNRDCAPRPGARVGGSRSRASVARPVGGHMIDATDSCQARNQGCDDNVGQAARDNPTNARNRDLSIANNSARLVLIRSRSGVHS
jgi:hypothetical protein